MLKDTRRAYNDLTSAGLDPTAANVIVDLLHERDEEVATKQDIELLRNATGRDIGSLRSEVQQEIALLRKEIELLRSEVKQDVEGVKQDIELLRKEIELVRADTRTDMEQLRIQMNRTIRNWVGGVGGLIALLITIFEFLGA